MAAEEKRSITIKINGQEVAASIKLVEKELAIARAELKKAEFGSDKYMQSMARIKELSPILNKHRADLKNVSQGTSGLTGIFQQMKSSVGSSGLLGSVIGAAAPIALIGTAFSALSSGLKTMKEFESAVSNLSARTGIMGQDLEVLKQQAVDLGVAYGQAPKGVIDAFAEAASARPELMKNTQELANFTEQALLLATVTKTDVNQVIGDLTTIMNTNSIASSSAADVINQLVGASQLGAKEVPFLSQAMEKIGGTAKNANVSLAEQSAVLEVLGEKYTSSAETAGTNVRNILITLQKEWQANNKGPFDFKQALDQLAPSVNDTTKLVDLFGKENVVAAQTLLQNRERIDELTTGIENFSNAQGVAETQMDNANSASERLSAQWEGLWAQASGGSGILTGLYNVIADAIGGFRLMASSISDVFRSVFDAEDLALEKANELNAAVRKNQKDMAASMVSSTFTASDGTKVSGIDRAKETMDKLRKAQQGLNADSEKYKTIQEKIDNLQVAINDRLAEQQKAKLEAEVARKQAAEDSRRQAGEEAKAQQKITEELIRQKQEKSKDSNFKEGIGPIKSIAADPLKPTIDLEAAKTKIFEEALQNRGNLEDQFNQNQNDAAAIDYAKRMEAYMDYAQLGINTVTQLATIGAQNRSNKELRALEEQNKKGLLSDEQYARKKEEIEKKAFERKKTIDIATALVNGALAITKVLAQTGTLSPFVIPGIIAETASQVAIIAAQKFGDGGMINGPSHSDGGTMVNAEGGEFVIKKKSVNSKTLPILREMNKTGLPVVNFGAVNSKLFSGNAYNGKTSGYDSEEVMNLRKDIREMVTAIKMTDSKPVQLVKKDKDDFDARIARVEMIAHK